MGSSIVYSLHYATTYHLPLTSILPESAYCASIKEISQLSYEKYGRTIVPSPSSSAARHTDVAGASSVVVGSRGGSTRPTRRR